MYSFIVYFNQAFVVNFFKPDIVMGFYNIEFIIARGHEPHINISIN